MVQEPSADSPTFRYKQVIAMRTDLKMSRGKTAVQVGHAAVSAAEEARKKCPDWWEAWMKEGQCKIAVRVDSEQALLELEERATKSKLPTALIIDRGLTEIPPDTITCLGIGPAQTAQIDALTGKLPLL
jgi:PTH2 family peptidyl-tRNA hydrolase